MKVSLLVVAHGSKSESTREQFEKIVALSKQKSDYDFVEGAYLEFSKPDIREAASSLIRKGASRIVIALYFLFDGIHTKRDIPEIIRGLSHEYPEIEFKITKPIGYEPVLADIILKRAGELGESFNID